MRRCSQYGLLAYLLIAAFPSIVDAQVGSNFVPVTPCRVLDTRVSAGPLGGPSLVANNVRSFPIPASPCGVPANASAYAVNLTVLPKGQLGVLVIWATGQPEPGATTVIFYNAYVNNSTIVPAGTGGSIDIIVNAPTDLVVDVNGYFIATSIPATQSTALGAGASTAGAQNTAIGFNTLNVNSGNANTATGAAVLSSNTSGSNNVGVGAAALGFNASGSANTAVGSQALLNNLIGNDNTAQGYASLWSNTLGSNNAAVGANALFNNTSGSNNTALGQNALYTNMDGSWNIAIGYQAGNQASSGNNNIEVGNQGANTDSNTIRIGTNGTQTSTFISGIYGTNISSGSAVLIDSNGQLGTSQSSERYKEGIHDMGDASDGVLQLRPVTFRYKKAADDGNKPLQYGLLGEEVAKIYPDLVVYNRDGKVENVEYHELPALLLNELQKQHKTIDEQQKLIDSMRSRLDAIELALKTNAAVRDHAAR
jgi:hypothetical protein